MISADTTVYEVKKTTYSIINLKAIARTDTWIRVITDSSNKYEKILKQGTTAYWKARDSIKIKIGNIPGIKLYSRSHPDKKYESIEVEKTGNSIGRLMLTNEFSQ